MFSIQKDHLSDIFYQLAFDHMHHGKRIQSRGSTRYEIPGYKFSLVNSNQNILMIPFRYNHPPAILAETLWVFAGRTDMDYLAFYLKGALKYSDDGIMWRGGYGKRLVNYTALDDTGRHYTVEQIDRAIAYLKKDRYTTRAVLVIPDGSDYQLDENGEERIDEPCTMFIQFLHRDGRLHCFTNMRSNDMVLGCFNVNLFEWTFLQALIANELHTFTGTYNVHAVSMHIYDDWMKRLPLLIGSRLSYDMYSIIKQKPFTLSWSVFKGQLSKLIEYDFMFRKCNVAQILDIVEPLKQQFHPDLFDCFCIMLCQHFVKRGAPHNTLKALQWCENDVYIVACLEWLARKLGRSFDGLIDTIAKTVLTKYDHVDFARLEDYIYHSREYKNMLDKLAGTRKQYESYRKRKTCTRTPLPDEG